MNRLFNSCRTYLQRKVDKLRSRCTVEIEHPRLLIKGKEYISDEYPNEPFTYIAFLGIPYAEPPLDHLRFQPPQPLKVRESGSRPLKIKAYNPDHQALNFSCDKSVPEGGLLGSEDCLYLNVYLPERPENISNLLPVLVYIHGGEFGRNPWRTKPDYIIRHNVVFVTMNYRVGGFGFLNMRTEECQGNAGLKDQVKALEWIQKNINKFGGDPNNVTISGHQAGATCVNLHMISPLSRNLFHKAIVQAGGIYSPPWGFHKKREYIMERMCMELFSRRSNDGTREAVVNYMKDMKAADLLGDFQSMDEEYKTHRYRKGALLFGPSEEFREQGAFIPPGESIESLMKQAVTVPVIAGITKQEGYEYFRMRRIWTVKDFMKHLFDNERVFTDFLLRTLNWSYETAVRRSDEIKQIYFGGSEIFTTSDFQELQDNLSTFLTDVWFHRFFDNFKIGEESVTRNAPLYVYRLDYFDTYRIDAMRIARHEDDILEPVTHTASGHSDDYLYLYNPKVIKLRIPDDPISHITKKMCSLWASFCKNGIPKYENFEWLPHTEGEPRYLSIDETLSMVPDRLGGDRWPLLKSMLEQESRCSTPSSIESLASSTSSKNSDLFRWKMKDQSKRW